MPCFPNVFDPFSVHSHTTFEVNKERPFDPEQKTSTRGGDRLSVQSILNFEAKKEERPFDPGQKTTTRGDLDELVHSHLDFEATGFSRACPPKFYEGKRKSPAKMDGTH